MSRPINMHSNFFSSLKQVEKRLKLEDNSSKSKYVSSPLTESLSSPIYLDETTEPQNHIIANHCSNNEDSEIPVEFMSNSVDFPSTNGELLPDKPPLNLSKTKTLEVEEDDGVDVDEIGSLIELLGLSDFDGSDSDLGLESCSSCHCDNGFLGKIAGVKGPKCKKEMERLEGWISHFRSEDIEPFALAHLLLGKAAFLHGNGDDKGFEGLEFPSTIEEFLRHDQPIA